MKIWRFSNSYSVEFGKLPLFNKMATILLVICPVLQTYGWGKWDFAFILTSLMSVFYFLRGGYRKSIPQWLLIYLGYCVVSVLLAATSLASIIQLSIVRVFLTYMLFFDVVEYNYLIKCYKSFLFICIAFFFFQEIMYYGFNIRVMGIFTNLPLALTEDSAEYYDKVQSWTRSASFFSEPSYLAQATLPLLCIELFDNQLHKKKNILVAGLLALVLVLLKSGTALLGLIVVFVFYIFHSLRNSKSFASVIWVVFVLVAASAFVSYYVKSDLGEETMSRTDQLSLDGSTTGQSGFIRIYRGYLIFDNYTPVEKITGIFNGDVIETKIRSSVIADSFMEGDQSFNTVQSILLRTGIIGMFIVVIFILSIWRGGNSVSHALICVIVALSFIESLYFKDLMTFYLVLIVASNRNTISEGKKY